MVHPYMRSSKHLHGDTVESAAKQVISMLPRIHALVIGPGLGRDGVMQDICRQVIHEARKQHIPFVLDADALQLVIADPSLVSGYRECILTPNVVEFGRLRRALSQDGGAQDDLPAQLVALANTLKGVTVVAKGATDLISDGRSSLQSAFQGGLKRSGGQGDTLTGAIATFLAWRKAYHDGLWSHDDTLSQDETLLLCAYGGSAITRECSKLAFQDKGRSMQASDLTDKVHQAFLNLIGEPAKSTL